MVIECNYHPNITTKAGCQINSLSFGVGDVYVILSRPNFGVETMITKDLTHMDVSECLRYQELKDKSMKEFCKPYLKSHYSEGFLEALRVYKRGALHGRFRNGFNLNDKVVGLDTIKCYPAIVRSLKAIPVFSQFDKFVQYKGEKISDFSMYHVKRRESVKPSNQNNYSWRVLLNNRYDIVYGTVVKKVIDDVEILAVCTPSKLYPNPFAEIIDEVFADELLSESVKKQILVSCIGYLGKIMGYASKQRLYATLEDATRDQKEFGGYLSFIGVGDGYTDKRGITYYKKKIYILQQSKSVDLENGYLPIQSLIYDECRLKLAETLEMVVNAGCEPIGVKTDCVFVSQSDAEKLDIPWKQDIDGCDIKNIGKLKKEISSIPKNIISAEWNKSNVQIFKKPKVNTHTLENEYSMKEFVEIFDKFDRVMIKAKHAGSGKSYACKKYIAGKNHAIACPQNAQARKLQLEGYNAMTLYDLCGSRPSDDGGAVQQTNAMKEYEIVVFEEVGQYTIKEWCMIKKYMNTFPNTRIIANGDELQNDPIEHNFNPYIRPEKYYMRIIDSIFPNQIMLEIPKRYKLDQMDRVKQLREDLFVNNMSVHEVVNKYAKVIKSMGEIPDNCAFITYRQETRKQMNEWEHQRRGLLGIFEGLVIRANCHMGKGKNTRINKHFDYKVTRIDKSSFDMIDESSGLEYKDVKSMWLKNFSFPYAYTGHSLQGDTLDKPIVIFDSQFEHVSRKWLYVALTRSCDLDNVYVFEGKKVLRIPIQDIDNKIIGYMRQDGNRIVSKRTNDINRNYIDVPWVLQRSKLQMHRCSCCCEVMNFENDGGMLDWTVDRIDSDKPHSKDNCVLMCYHCNISKKDNIIV